MLAFDASVYEGLGAVAVQLVTGVVCIGVLPLLAVVEVVIPDLVGI